MTLASKSLITMTDYQDSFMTANLIWRGVLEQNANEPIFQCITKAQFFARNYLFSQGPMPLRDVLVKLRGRLRRKKLMHIVKFDVTWKLSFYINEKIFHEVHLSTLNICKSRKSMQSLGLWYSILPSNTLKTVHITTRSTAETL